METLWARWRGIAPPCLTEEEEGEEEHLQPRTHSLGAAGGGARPDGAPEAFLPHRCFLSSLLFCATSFFCLLLSGPFLPPSVALDRGGVGLLGEDCEFLFVKVQC